MKIVDHGSPVALSSSASCRSQVAIEERFLSRSNRLFEVLHPVTRIFMGSVGMDDNETRCFTNWFKNLAQYRNGQVGDVNVYKGQYIDNIYYWTDQKPRIFLVVKI